MKTIKMNHFISVAMAVLMFLGLFSLVSTAQTPVNGRNVTEIKWGKTSVEGVLRKVGPKTWNHLYPDGKRVYTTHTETGRDAWSVYLTGSVYSSTVINLWKKTVEFKTPSGARTLRKILASSNGAVKTSTAGNSSAQIEQQCFNAIQGKVAYNRTGSKTWSASNVQRLCKGTTSTANTIACFKREIQAHNSWSRGVNACKSNPTVAKAAAATKVATSGTIEQQCFNAIQGKVAYNRTGSKTWSASNVQRLCKGTTSTANTIACFKREIQAHNSWSRGVNACKSNPTVAKAAAATTVTRSAPIKKRSPLTINEMAHVMKWISVKTSAARLPFCWRKSRGRGAGKPMVCQAGYKQDTAGLCYKPCRTNEKGIATFCYRNCPAGFRDDGLYCGKPKATSRGAGYVIWQKAKCEKENPQGCVKGGAIWYPKCKPGYRAIGLSCSPICPSGFSDIGVSCKKPNYARDVKPLTRCINGLEKSGAICYPKCQNDYTGRGPVCWQNCPGHQNVNCGAGCATTKGQCAKAVFTMVSAPIVAALKITALVVTFGGSSAATGGAAAAAAGGKIALKSPKLVKLAQMAAKLQKLYNANQKLIKAALATKTVIGSIKSQTELFATEFANNFGDMTTPAVEKEIDRRFSKEAAFEIKREWGANHLAMMMEANGINTAKNVLDIAGIADPTGLVGIVSAFTNPLCKDNTPFPTVRPKY